MAVLEFETKEVKREKKIDKLVEQRDVMSDETEALFSRMDLKQNNGVELTEEDFLEVLSSMARKQEVSKQIRELRCQDPELKEKIQEHSDDSIYSSWKKSIHSGEQILTPFAEVNE